MAGTHSLQKLWSARSWPIVIAFGLLLLWPEIGRGVQAYRAKASGSVSSWDVRGEGADVDAVILHGGVVRYPDLLSTLRWWYGPWVGADVEIPGQKGRHVVFYRPVPSLSFWAEWRLFEGNERRYGTFNVAFVVANLILLGATVSLLARRLKIPWPIPSALLTMFGFATGFMEGIDLLAPRTLSAVLRWKNLPDLQALFFLLLALLFYIRVREVKETAFHHLIWLTPLFLACGSKEIVILIPLLFPVVEWTLQRDDPRDGSRRRAAIALAFFVLFNAFRLIVLRGSTGYRYGTPQWFPQAVSELYPWGGAVIMRDWIMVATAVAIVGAFIVDRQRFVCSLPYLRRIAFALAWLPVVIATGLLTIDTRGMNSISAVAASALYSTFTIAERPLQLVGLVFAPFAVMEVYRKAPGVLAIATSWAVLNGIPNVFSPSPLHRYYISNVGWSILYGTGFALLLHALWKRVEPRFNQGASTQD